MMTDHEAALSLYEWAGGLSGTPESATWSGALPPATMTQLAYYSAAAGVVDPIHYDREFARERGFRDAVVNGSLRVSWMAYAAVAIGPAAGELIGFRCEHRGIACVGDDLEMQATIGDPFDAGAEGLQREVSFVLRGSHGVYDVGSGLYRVADR